MNYNQLVEQHFFDPQNIGEITAVDGCVFIGTAVAGSDSVGERVVLYLGCDAESKIIIARYKIFGSPYMIAAMSVISEWLRGLHLSAALEIDCDNVITQLAMPLTKQHCAMLAVDAVQRAVAQVQQLIFSN